MVNTIARRTAAATAAVLLMAGCSTPSTPGRAVRASDAANAPVVALMDTGAYTVTPSHPFGAVGDNVASQNLMEAHRIAEYTVGPWEVDDALRTLPGAIDSGLNSPLDSVKMIRDNGVMPTPWPDVAEAHGFQSGFASARVTSTGPQRSLQNVVLHFPDAAAAAAAAAEMVAKAPPMGDVAPGPPAPLANTPESLALTYALPDDVIRVDSFTAHGPYVLYESAVTPTLLTGGVAAVLADSALNAQKKRIDEFTPTAPAELPNLSLDPTGRLLSLTLSGPDNAAPVMAGVWAPQAWLHFEYDPVAAAALFKTAGVDAVTQRLTTLYQAGNADGAARIAEEFAKQTGNLVDVAPIDGVAGLPSARCYQRNKGALPPTAAMTWQRLLWHVRCIATVDRYVYTGFSADPADVRQQMAAQYRILAGE